jgi:hypothetical protein
MKRYLFVPFSVVIFMLFPTLNGEALAQTGGPPGIRAFSIEEIVPDKIQKIQYDKLISTSYMFSARFLCGRVPNTSPEDPSPLLYPMGPGTYLSSISIYNPNTVAVSFTKRASTSPAGGQAGKIGPQATVYIAAKQALDIDCSGAASMLGLPPFALTSEYFSGFIEVFFVSSPSTTPYPLHVTGAYTACNLPGAEEGGCGGGGGGEGEMSLTGKSSHKPWEWK